MEKLNILWQNADLLALNKPAGWLSHVGAGKRLRPDILTIAQRELNLSLVLYHRLDEDTSGVILLGKNRDANAHFHRQFEKRLITKKYLAVVDGRWPAICKKIENYIQKSSAGYSNRSSGPQKNFASSDFEILSTNGERTLIRVCPHTGKTHQIRLHCLFANHPICGDKVYGKKDPHGVPMALHAESIEIELPDRSNICIAAPLPARFTDYWLSDMDKPFP